MKLYKLTDKHGCTRNDTQWGDGVTHTGTGVGELCGPGYIHAYEHPLLAVLLNPIHANFKNPRLWEAEGDVVKREGQLKCGCVSLTTVREIPLPEVTTEHRVKFAIACALEVYDDKAFAAWAQSWLDGSDRSDAAAWAAARAAEAAARAARSAACAARSAAKAAARAARSTACAARSAAKAAANAADVDLVKIAEGVMK